MTTQTAEPKTYPVHPLANLFPQMTGKEFKALVDDIRANGLRQPIVLFAGAILDGRHRYGAAKEAGRELTVKEFEGTYIDALKFVISQNLHRRHLNPSQLSIIAAGIANVKLGTNQHTKEGSSIDLPTAAAMLGVGEASVKRAKNVLENAAPEVVERIRQGTVRVGAVTKNVLKLAHADQVKAVEAEKAEQPGADANTAYANAEKRLIEKLEALPLDEAEERVRATSKSLRSVLEKKEEAATKKKAA